MCVSSFSFRFTLSVVLQPAIIQRIEIKKTVGELERNRIRTHWPYFMSRRYDWFCKNTTKSETEPTASVVNSFME